MLEIIIISVLLLCHLVNFLYGAHRSSQPTWTWQTMCRSCWGRQNTAMYLIVSNYRFDNFSHWFDSLQTLLSTCLSWEDHSGRLWVFQQFVQFRYIFETVHFDTLWKSGKRKVFPQKTSHLHQYPSQEIEISSTGSTSFLPFCSSFFVIAAPLPPCGRNRKLLTLFEWFSHC